MPLEFDSNAHDGAWAAAATNLTLLKMSFTNTLNYNSRDLLYNAKNGR